jgi:type IV secretory pathway VirD2 relaxase
VDEGRKPSGAWNRSSSIRASRLTKRKPENRGKSKKIKRKEKETQEKLGRFTIRRPTTTMTAHLEDRGSSAHASPRARIVKDLREGRNKNKSKKKKSTEKPREIQCYSRQDQQNPLDAPGNS